MSILEAMYQGCSVIARHAPGPDFIIEDNVSGFLVSGIDSMTKIIKSDVKLNQEEIKKRIKEHFVWDATADIMIRTLKMQTLQEPTPCTDSTKMKI